MSKHYDRSGHDRWGYDRWGNQRGTSPVFAIFATISAVGMAFIFLTAWPMLRDDFAEGWRYGQLGTVLIDTLLLVFLAAWPVLYALYLLLVIGQSLLDTASAPPVARQPPTVEQAEGARASAQGWAVVWLVLAVPALVATVIDAEVQIRQHGGRLGPLSHALWVTLVVSAVARWSCALRADRLATEVYQLRVERVQAQAHRQRQIYLAEVAEAQRLAADAAAREAAARAAELAERAAEAAALAAQTAQTAALAASQAREEEVRVARRERDRLHNAEDRRRAEELRDRLSRMRTLPASRSPIPLHEGEVCHYVVPAWSLSSYDRTDGLTPLDRGEMAPVHHLVLTSHRVVFLDSAEQHVSDLTRVERLCVEGAYCLAVKMRIRPLYDVFQMDGPAEFASYLACAAERAGQTPEVIYSAGVADASRRG